MTECQILEEIYENDDNNEEGVKGEDKENAKVKFIATMIQVDSREKTSFMETSTFERAGKHIREGAWLYKSGIVEPVTIVYEDGGGGGEGSE